jgi:hypothetical protein
VIVFFGICKSRYIPETKENPELNLMVYLGRKILSRKTASARPQSWKK